MKISLLIPVYNEEENLPRLYDQIRAVAERETLDLEMIFVDDGSQDGSWAVLESLSSRDARVRAVKFRRNFGQTAGLAAAIDQASMPPKQVM
jgi:glycosyltransferase involved in cell wall biosynthesis